MGQEISKKKIEKISGKKLLKLKSSTVRDLEPDEKLIYDHRMFLLSITAQKMEEYVDIMVQNFQPSDMKDLRPDARAVYERRVKYHQMISNLLENNMIEIIAEPVKEAPKNEEDEDDKQQEEEKEKKQEKTLYDIHFVYRTVEKRLSQHPQNYVAGSFGFKDKIGEGINTVLHAFYDPSFDTEAITIKKKQDGTILHQQKSG